MAYNKVENINRARAQKDDEFYTPYSVVKKELDNYTDQLKDKDIICPCESPKELIDILEFIEIKEVRNRGLLNTTGKIYKVNLNTINEDTLTNTETLTGNFIKYLLLNRNRLKFKSLSFSGMSDNNSLDFRSIDYSNYDIVITNPPFTLMKDFLSIVVNRYKKDTILLSSQIAITLTSFISNIISGKLHYAYTKRLDSLYYLKYEREVLSSELYGNTAACCGFFTTLETEEPAEMELSKKDISLYKRINGVLLVGKTKEIPDNYYDKMIVPITYLQKHNSKQFKLLDILQGPVTDEGEQLFQKLLIQRCHKQL